MASRARFPRATRSTLPFVLLVYGNFKRAGDNPASCRSQSPASFPTARATSPTSPRSRRSRRKRARSRAMSRPRRSRPRSKTTSPCVRPGRIHFPKPTPRAQPSPAMFPNPSRYPIKLMIFSPLLPLSPGRVFDAECARASPRPIHTAAARDRNDRLQTQKRPGLPLPSRPARLRERLPIARRQRRRPRWRRDARTVCDGSKLGVDERRVDFLG